MTNAGSSWAGLVGPGRMTRIILERQEDELVLSITMSSSESDVTEQLSFRNARDVHFRGARTELSEISILMVQEISGDGWDGIRYRVKDYEEAVISLYCKSIERLTIPKTI